MMFCHRKGLAGMAGRLVFGLLGDRFGAARVLTLALLAQAVVALGYAAARELGSFYAVAALFGFTYAGVMPLFAVIARENFPLHLMGTVIGGTATARTTIAMIASISVKPPSCRSRSRGVIAARDR